MQWSVTSFLSVYLCSVCKLCKSCTWELPGRMPVMKLMMNTCLVFVDHDDTLLLLLASKVSSSPVLYVLRTPVHQFTWIMPWKSLGLLLLGLLLRVLSLSHEITSPSSISYYFLQEWSVDHESIFNVCLFLLMSCKYECVRVIDCILYSISAWETRKGFSISCSIHLSNNLLPAFCSLNQVWGSDATCITLAMKKKKIARKYTALFSVSFVFLAENRLRFISSSFSWGSSPLFTYSSSSACSSQEYSSVDLTDDLCFGCLVLL